MTPPRSFLRKRMSGFSLFTRTPKPSSSYSSVLLSVTGLEASSTMRSMLHVRAAAITCLPRPLPSFAPSMIPGKSTIWILAPR